MPQGAERRKRRLRLLAPILILLVLILSSGLVERDGDKKEAVGAVILDPLGNADNGFTSSCLELFESAGYEVDVYRGEEVSVSMIKKISGSYKIVVLRVHSSVHHGRVWFFTGEEYSQGRYVLEQLVDEVHPARPTLGSEFLFAVGAEFVLHFLEDRFDGALVVVMGCDGLSSQDLAKAFLDAGADAYVSWDGPVSLRHTDEATLAMLRALVEDGKSLGDAVEHSMELVGPDPSHSSVLRLFPEGGAAFSVSR